MSELTEWLKRAEKYFLEVANGDITAKEALLAESCHRAKNHIESQDKRIAELEAVIQDTIDDLLIRGEIEEDGRRVVNLSASTWIKLNESLDKK